MTNENEVVVDVVTETVAEVASAVGIEVGTEDLILTIDRKEYTVVGDDVYITRSVEAPQWLTTMVENLAAVQLDSALADVSNLRDALDDAVAAMNIAKNEYELAIISYSDLVQIVNAKIETLNSSLSAVDATIIEVMSTKVSVDQATALAAQSIVASLADGALKATVDSIRSSIVTEAQSRAIAIDSVRSELYLLADSVDVQADAIATLESSVSLVDGPIKTALAGIQSSVTTLEAQIDGVVQTTTGVYEPLDPSAGTLVLWQNPPTNSVKTLYKEWLDANTLDGHIGDTYVLVANIDGIDTYVKSWKFQQGVVGANNVDVDGYGWYPITDSTAIEALAAAVAARDLADGKRRVFVTTPYVPYDVGDLWSGGSTGDLKRCKIAKPSTGVYSSSDWELATKYTDDSALTSFVTGPYAEALTEVSSQIDQKAVAYYEANAPHDEVSFAVEDGTYDAYVNDIWYQTVGDMKTYIYDKVYNGVLADDSGLLSNSVTSTYAAGLLIEGIELYEDNGSIVGVGGTYDGKYYYRWLETPIPQYVFDKIDGKKTIYTTQPSIYAVNDLWIPSVAVGEFEAGEIYVATATSSVFTADDWIVATSYTDKMLAIKSALEAQIDNKIETVVADSAPTGLSASNSGDLWLCTKSSGIYNKGSVYKYTHPNEWVIDNRGFGDVFDTYDGKKTIYGGNVAPSNAEVNDLWIPSEDVGNYVKSEIYIYTGNTWIVATKYTEDLASYTSVVDKRLDNEVTIYSQDEAPVFVDEDNDSAHGDIWIDSDAAVGATKYYRYDAISSSWVVAPELDGIFKDLNLKGNVTYRTITSGLGSSESTPITTTYPADFFGDVVGTKNGDTLLVTYWYSKSGIAKQVTDMYLWDGDSWGVAGVSATAKSKWAIDQEINIAGLGTSISGTNQVLTSLEGTVEDNYATVQSKFLYDSTLAIDGTVYQTGFGLATSITQPDSSIPVGSSEFWVRADKMKMVAASQSAAAQAPFSVNATSGDITFNGKVSFSNVVGAEKPSANLLSNSAPALGSETAMWETGWYTTSPAPTAVYAGFDTWRPAGSGSVYIHSAGNPVVGSVFDINQIGTIAVVSGARYEATSLLSSHRCTSYCNVVWFNASGTYISESITSNQNAGVSHRGALSGWVRYGGFVIAPVGAAFCKFTVRSLVTGNDPYCFVAQAYFGRATTTQTIFSEWVEGSGISGNGIAQAINSNTTTINGNKLTTGSVTADKIDATLLTLGGSGASYARVSKDGLQVVVNGVTRVKIGLL